MGAPAGNTARGGADANPNSWFDKWLQDMMSGQNLGVQPGAFEATGNNKGTGASRQIGEFGG